MIGLFCLAPPLLAGSLRPLDAWRTQVTQARLQAESDAPGAYRRAQELQTALPADALPSDRVRVLNLVARSELYLALTEEAATHARTALDLAARYGDQEGQVEAELNLALNSLNQGNLDAVVAAVVHAQTLLDGVPRSELQGEALLLLATTYRRLDQLDESLAAAVRAMEMAERSRDPWFLAYAHEAMGISFEQSHRPEEAKLHFQQMRDAARLAHSKLMEARALQRLGKQFDATEAPNAGESEYREGLALCRAIGNPFCVTSGLYGLAENLRSQGRLAETLPLLDETIRIYEQHPNKIGLWWTLSSRSQSYQALGRAKESLNDAERAYRLAKDIHFPYYLNESAKRLALVHALAGDYRRAYAYLQDAISSQALTAQEALSTRTLTLAKRYESEHKQHQIDELTRLNQQQHDQLEHRLLWTAAVGSMALLLVTAYFLLRLRRSRAEIKQLNTGLEQRVQARTEELRQREQEYRTLAENSPSFIVRYGSDCRHTYGNPAFEQLTGIPVEASLGKRPEDIPALTDKVYQNAIEQVLDSGESAKVEFACAPEGHERWGSVHFVPERSADGRVVSVLGIGHDVTERKQRERQEEIRRTIFERLARGGVLSEVLALMVHCLEAHAPGLHCAVLLQDEHGHLSIGTAPRLPADYAALVADLKAPRDADASAFAAELARRLGADGRLSGPLGMDTRWAEPIVSAGGAVLGVLLVHQDRDEAPATPPLGMIHQAAHMAAIAIERKHIEERMRRQASYDHLTGLPNRRLFSDRLGEEIAKANRRHKEVALLFVDLDRFKEINDSLGHDTGDRLLVEAAKRIHHQVRESDTVARLGGDEFVVIVPDTPMPQLGRIAQNLVDALGLPFRMGENTIFVSASIGIASYPSDAKDVEGLLGCADQAMYAAKEAGRNGFGFFTAAMQETMQHRLRLANDLRDALDGQQLIAYFQPIVEAATGRVVKAEALLRWKHPQLGMVPPDQFIPIAEDTGAIHDIGDWMFEASAALAARWLEMRRDAGTAAAPCQVSVNVSPRQFLRSELGDAWIEHLGQIGLPTRSLVIEITEGLLLSDQADVMGKLGRLRSAGLEIALDDFGTGYSAMAYLKKFPIDYLKIDRSFVRDLETDPSDRAIAEAIVAMAHRLDLKVIAEGVETEQQQSLLTGVGCEYIQGYLYARPMPAEDFLDYVRATDAAA